MSSMTARQEKILYALHIIAATGHLGTALFSYVRGRASDLWTPSIESSYETWDIVSCVTEDSDGYCFRQLRVVDTYPYSVLIASVSSPVWSGLAHVFTLWTWRSVYLPQLRRGYSSIRWADYVFSSSILITVIAVFAGVADVWSLLCISVLQVVVILLGQMSEKSLLFVEQRRLFFVSSLVYTLGVWYPVASTFFQSIGTIPDELGNLPVALGVGFGAFALVYSSFAVVALVNLYTGSRHYIACEVAYVILSLTAKPLVNLGMIVTQESRGANLSNRQYTPETTGTAPDAAMYQVIGGVVGTNMIIAAVVFFLWRCYGQKNEPATIQVDRNLLRKEMMEALVPTAPNTTKRAGVAPQKTYVFR